MAETKGKNADKNKGKADKDKRTAKDYGFVKAFLDDHPGVRKLVNRAVKEQWTPERFQTEVRGTYWWREHTDAQRRADLMMADNPTEWERQVGAMATQLDVQAKAMGISYTPAELQKYAQMSVRNGYSTQEVTSWLAGHGSLDTDDASGAASVTTDALRKMASMYGLRVSDATLTAKVRQALGSGDPSGFISGYEDTLREQAKMMYPSIADKLDGSTVMDLASGYLEDAAQELGIDPDMMDLTDPKWTRMFSGDALMSREQWRGVVRSDESYGWAKTNSAKDQATNFAQQLLGLMRGGVGV